MPLGGRKKKKIEQHLERLPENAFSEVRPARDGSSGRRPWEWACVELAPDPERGMRRWLLVRRSTDDPEEMGFYQAYGPEGTTVEELVRVCQERWQLEECFAEAKGEAGLDHYEVRKWEAWHRHITLCLLAHAFLAVVRSSVEREEGAGKRGSRSRPDPPDGARGETAGARDGRAERTKTFPTGVVFVEKRSPVGGRSLPAKPGKPGGEARGRAFALRADAPPDHGDRPRGGEAH